MGDFSINVCKISINLYNSLLKRILLITLIILVFFISKNGIGQENLGTTIHSDTLVKSRLLDSITKTRIDSLRSDSIKIKQKSKKEVFSDPVNYSAKDSMPMDMESKKIYLYGDAHVTYQNIDLKAAYIEFDMDEQTVYATGVKDSTGKYIGYPVFKQGKDSYDAHWLRYNFKTKKGFIHFVKTKQGEGTLIGDSTKRTPEGNINIKGATYSTCDLDHPHFYMQLTKAKSIPGDKIVAGPSYFVFADVPFPFLGIPFGFFPNTKDFSSGMLMPTWGEEPNRGFYVANGGYYFGISDYVDAKITGDIYSKGTWALHAQSNYRYRYNFAGSFALNYYYNVTSEKDLPNYTVQKLFNVTWNHYQDAKANPNSSFRANVNFSSRSNFAQKTSYDPNQFLSNSKQSAVSYDYNWPNKLFHLSTSAQVSQNSNTKQSNFLLPSMSFGMNTIYPFRRKEATGEMRWYENIQLNYTANLQNTMVVSDSLMFTKKMFDNMKNGFSHSIPLSTNFKLGKYINVSPSLNYQGVMYTSFITHKFVYDSIKNLSTYPMYHDSIFTHKKLVYGQSFYPSLSVSFSPKVYGMYVFQNSKIKAIRHVISPTLGFSYIPNMSGIVPNYKRTDRAMDGKTYNYTVFGTSTIYGVPQGTSQSASISMSLNNSFEMKYISGQDTAEKEKKIALLRNLNFSSSYNLLADSNNLAPINMSTGTDLFNNKLNISGNATFNPYACNSKGGLLRNWEWQKTGKLARLTNASLQMSTSFTSSEGKKTDANKKDLNNTKPTLQNNNNDNIFVTKQPNFDIPWSVRGSYSWYYTNPGGNIKPTIAQSINFSGDLSITKNWKVGFSSGYDITHNDLTYTSVNINRDLHCWVMSFNWSPFGPYASYNFTINAKASLLKDLKYTKRSDWQDNY